MLGPANASEVVGSRSAAEMGDGAAAAAPTPARIPIRSRRCCRRPQTHAASAIVGQWMRPSRRFRGRYQGNGRRCGEGRRLLK